VLKTGTEEAEIKNDVPQFCAVFLCRSSVPIFCADSLCRSSLTAGGSRPTQRHRAEG
jgi:hypothetical protein